MSLRWLKSPIFWGGCISVGYLAGVAFLAKSLVADWREPLELNQLGDFLAGVFAPLAFIWFLIAIFLQRSELAAQREELKLARETLGLQVVGQDRLIDQSEEQLTLQKSLRTSQSVQRALDDFDAELISILIDIVELCAADMLLQTDKGHTNLYIPKIRGVWKKADISDGPLAVMQAICDGCRAETNRLERFNRVSVRDSPKIIGRIKDVDSVCDRLSGLCNRYEARLGSERLHRVAKGLPSVITEYVSVVESKVQTGK